MSTLPQTAPVTAPPSLACATRIARIMDELKAVDIIALDLKGVADVADYFVICTVHSAPQMKALAWRVFETLKSEGLPPVGPIEDESPRWNIIDYGDVVAHIFDAEARKLYQLEKVWGDAPEIVFDSAGGRTADAATGP